MTDNVTLNPGSGGASVRAKNISGTLTQVVQLDMGGESAESLVTSSNPLPILAADGAAVSSGTMVSGNTFVVDTIGYQSLQITTTSGFSAAVSASNDNATWQSLDGLNVSIASGYVTTVGSAQNYQFPAIARYIRFVATASGSITGWLRQQPWCPDYTSSRSISVSTVGSNTSNSQTVGQFNVTSTTPAATLIVSGIHRLTQLTLENAGTVGAWLHLYNATSVTLGTTAAAMSFYCPPGSYRDVTLPEAGLYIGSTGISAAFTAGGTTTDNTSFGSAPNLACNYSHI